MCAYHVTAPQASGSSVEAWLTWVGGGERRELHERHERSAHAVAGVVVLATVALTWLVTTLAIMQATRLSSVRRRAIHSGIRTAGGRGQPDDGRRPDPRSR